MLLPVCSTACAANGESPVALAMPRLAALCLRERIQPKSIPMPQLIAAILKASPDSFSTVVWSCNSSISIGLVALLSAILLMPEGATKADACTARHAVIMKNEQAITRNSPVRPQGAVVSSTDHVLPLFACGTCIDKTACHQVVQSCYDGCCTMYVTQWSDQQMTSQTHKNWEAPFAPVHHTTSFWYVCRKGKLGTCHAIVETLFTDRIALVSRI